MESLEGMAKFGLGDTVKCQVFNIVTTGKIVRREFKEWLRKDEYYCAITYTLDFGADLVENDENTLVNVQGLPLGEIKNG